MGTIFYVVPSFFKKILKKFKKCVDIHQKILYYIQAVAIKTATIKYLWAISSVGRALDF